MSLLAERLLLPFLEKYAHPTCVHTLDDILEASNGMTIQPTWCNATYATEFARHPPPGVGDLVYSVALSQQSGHAPGADVCSVSSRGWTFTATILDGLMIITSTPRTSTATPKVVIETKDLNFKSPSSNLVVQQRSEVTRPLSRDSQLDARTVELWSRTQMGQLIITYPWETTPLGPVGSWSPELMMLVTMTLEWPERLCLWFGDDALALFNDHYLKVVGPRKHVRMLGKPFKDVYPEFWDDIKDRVWAAQRGERIYVRAGLIFMDRERPEADQSSWGLEETYHDWSYTPIRIGNEIVGFSNESREVTAAVVAKRRMSTIHGIRLSAEAATREGFYDGIIDEFTRNNIDFPFVLTYTVQMPSKAAHSRASSSASSTRLKLHRKMGVPNDHAFAPSVVEISGPAMSSGSVTTARSTDRSNPTTPQPNDFWPFEECLLTGESVLVPSLGPEAAELPCLSWGTPCHSAVVFPVGVKDDFELVVVLGLNPCRPYDREHMNHITLLQTTMSAGLATVTSIETTARKAEELASLDRAKTVFFGNVTHELRTPLQLILGPVEDLLVDERIVANSVAHSQLQLVSRHSRRLLQLVNSLLDFARLEAGRSSTSFRPVNLGELTANFASLFRSAIERGGIQFDVKKTPGPEVYVDLDAWEKVVTNIVSNAFKYTLKGRIEVRVEYTSTHAIFACSDTGVGIPEDDLSNIFQRFHRVENCGGRSIEGTGVGLALTFETVKSLGGTLSVQSEFSVGSIFTVSLPLGTDHIPEDRLMTNTSLLDLTTPTSQANSMRYGTWLAEAAQGWLSPEPVKPMPPIPSESLADEGSIPATTESDPETLGSWTLMTDEDREKSVEGSVILLCDDNADLREYCARILTPHFKVVGVPNGEVAAQYVASNTVDLVLSDVHMPIMDGYELLRHVRSQPTTTLIPVILVSAAAGVDPNTKAMNAGADDFLVKPFTSKDLRNRVKRQLLVGGMRRDLEARVQSRTRLLVESEQQLLQKIEESERMRKQQEIVVDLTSHEIRNPLNAIWQNADLINSVLERLHVKLEGQPVSQLLKDADDAVQSIIVSVAHQTRIADDVLDFSKITVNLLTLHREPFLLYDTIQNVVRWWDMETRERDISTDIDGSPELQQQWIVSDSQRVSQVLINFLMNAIRFTADSKTRRITVFMQTTEHLHEPALGVHRVNSWSSDPPTHNAWLTIGVRDTGSGLSQEERLKLFERFAQAHPSKDQFTGGHGLGLFVSRHITQLLGGVVDVESTKGVGSTFSFTIPIELIDRPPDGANLPARPARFRPLGTQGWASRPALTRTVTSSKRHIVVVEDNIINQKVLTRQLQSRGFKTSVAADGQEALNLIQAAGFDGDLILMDIEMPVKDGKTACRELRQWESKRPGPRLPVVAVTGNARAEQVQDCLDAGFDHVATKPYQINDLVDTIQSLIGQRRV